MPKITENDLVRGVRGNFSKQFVYKKRGEGTHLTRMPDLSGVKWSESQIRFREFFSAASLYAKAAIADPDVKRQYQEMAAPGQTAFNVATRDYMKPPEVTDIDFASFNGQQGSTITITAWDDFRVVEVIVAIYTTDGHLQEESLATLNPIDFNLWTFISKNAYAAIGGTKIRATARDLPGNTAWMEVTL